MLAVGSCKPVSIMAKLINKRVMAAPYTMEIEIEPVVSIFPDEETVLVITKAVLKDDRGGFLAEFRGGRVEAVETVGGGYVVNFYLEECTMADNLDEVDREFVESFLHMTPSFKVDAATKGFCINSNEVVAKVLNIAVSLEEKRREIALNCIKELVDREFTFTRDGRLVPRSVFFAENLESGSSYKVGAPDYRSLIRVVEAAGYEEMAEVLSTMLRSESVPAGKTVGEVLSEAASEVVNKIRAKIQKLESLKAMIGSLSADELLDRYFTKTTDKGIVIFNDEALKIDPELIRRYCRPINTGNGEAWIATVVAKWKFLQEHEHEVLQKKQRELAKIEADRMKLEERLKAYESGKLWAGASKQ